MKYLISISIGLLTGLLSISLSEYAVMAMFPLNNSFDFQDITVLYENMNTTPMQNLISILIGYALSSLLAGFVSTKIKTGNHFIPIIIIGITLTMFGFIYLLIIPHPLWMVVAGSIIFIPMTWLGSKICQASADEKVIYKF